MLTRDWTDETNLTDDAEKMTTFSVVVPSRGRFLVLPVKFVAFV
jgi:hypothetical protein